MKKMALHILLKLEFQKLTNDLRLSLEKTTFIASYLLVLVSSIFLHQGLHLILFKVPELREHILLLGMFWNINVIKIFLQIWLLYSIIKGVLSHDFVEMFDDADMLILFSSPLSRKNIYLSRYIMSFIRRILIVALLFISINPIFSFINLSKLELYILFFTVLIFIELNYTLSNISFLVIRTRLTRFLKTQKLKKMTWLFLTIIFIGLSSFLFSPIMRSQIRSINPISLMVDTIESISVDSANTYQIMSNLIILVLIYTSLTLISYLLSNNFDFYITESTKNIQDQRANFFKLIFRWINLEKKIGVHPIFWKDVISILRERGLVIIFELIINYGVFSFLFIQFNLFLDFTTLDNYYSNLYVILPPMVTIIFLNVYSPLTELLKDEVIVMWLLKTSGLRMYSLLVSKYLFSVIKSLIFSLPLLLMFYLGSPYNKFIVLFLIINVIFIYNSIGLLITSFFIFESKNFFADTFVFHFIQIIVSFIITGFYVSLLFFHPAIMLLLFILVISISITEYNIPNGYLGIDFLTKFNLVGLITFYFIGFVFIFVESRVHFLNITHSSFFNLSLFFIISLVITYNMFRISTKLTTKNLIQHDEF
jgi:hypothetical protein